MNKFSSPNYKGEGDLSECGKCFSLANGNRKKYWPFDCWILHEDKRSEKFRNNNNSNIINNKLKVNTAGKDRPDDFVDNSNTHITVMGYLAISEEDMMGDEEYWGCTFNQVISKGSGKVLKDQQNIETLDYQDIAIQDIQEKVENELSA